MFLYRLRGGSAPKKATPGHSFQKYRVKIDKNCHRTAIITQKSLFFTEKYNFSKKIAEIFAHFKKTQ